MTDEDVTDTIHEILKRFGGQQVDFADAIEQLRRRRTLLIPAWDKHHTSEYCYQLVSLLMESQKILNGEAFSMDYINEKTEVLKRIALSIWNEERTEDKRYD